MNSNHRATVRVHHWGAGLGLAIGVGVATVMLGMGTAHADPSVDTSTSTDPATLLDSAASDLTQASDVLSKADVSASLQQILGEQTQSADAFSQLISQAQSIQDPLLSSRDSVVSGLANLFFGDIDQKLAHGSAAALSADQAFAADPSEGTEASLVIPDLQLDGAAIDSLFPDLIGVFVDRLLAIPAEGVDSAGGNGADAAANGGAELATGFGLPF
jgi:hypothetical protein